MNIYKNLNEIIEYIERNLENKIDYKIISQILGTNENTVKRVFPLLTNISISEYIRNRRLSKKSIPELEYYHDNITEFLIAIED